MAAATVPPETALLAAEGSIEEESRSGGFHLLEEDISAMTEDEKERKKKQAPHPWRGNGEIRRLFLPGYWLFVVSPRFLRRMRDALLPMARLAYVRPCTMWIRLNGKSVSDMIR
jgi:hypothetical protein